MSDREDKTGGASLAALAGMPISSRFCSWKGLSGGATYFVYPAPDCPAFRDAILLAAVRDSGGHRRVISVRETSPFLNRWSPRLNASSGLSALPSNSISICWPRRLRSGRRPSPIWR